MFGGTKTKRLALGIDIGPGVIKAAVLAQEDSSWVVTHALRVPTPAGCVDHGVITAPAEVATALKTMLRGLGIRSAAAAIPADQSIVRYIELPRLDGESLRAATPFEARKHLSYPVEQAEVQIVPEADAEVDGGMMKALLVAAPRDIVQSRAITLELAGLDISCMELEAFALMRALYTPDVRRTMLWSSHSRAYLQLGEDMSCMYVLQHGKLRFVRPISWGSGHLTQALMQALECSQAEAVRVKEDDGSSVADNGELIFRSELRPSSETEAGTTTSTDSLIPEFTRLCREIQRMMSYYQSLFPEGSYEGILNQITLCGGAAGLKGMSRYLGNRLDIEFDVADMFAQRALRMGPGIGESLQKYRSSYTVAIGLALGQMQTAMQSHDSGDLEYVWRRCA